MKFLPFSRFMRSGVSARPRRAPRRADVNCLAVRTASRSSANQPEPLPALVGAASGLHIGCSRVLSSVSTARRPWLPCPRRGSQAACRCTTSPPSSRVRALLAGSRFASRVPEFRSSQKKVSRLGAKPFENTRKILAPRGIIQQKSSAEAERSPADLVRKRATSYRLKQSEEHVERGHDHTQGMSSRVGTMCLNCSRASGLSQGA